MVLVSGRVETLLVLTSLLSKLPCTSVHRKLHACQNAGGNDASGARNTAVLTAFCWVLLWSPGLYWVLFCWVLFCWVLFYWVLFCWVLFCWVLFCWVLFNRVLFCWVILGSAGFCSAGFCSTGFCSTGFCSVGFY